MSARAVPPDRSPLGWLILLPLGCLVLAQTLLAWTGVTPVLDGALADPDSYMRLNRVLALHDGGAWFDPRDPRINPPEGHVQHWTRPLDALLFAGAWLLEPFLGFREALHVLGVLLSPVVLCLCLIALAWASAPVLDRDARLFACLALLTQPTVVAYSSLGRPDHHTLLLLLFILFVGQILRLLDGATERRLALGAGAVAALGVWISPEALSFIAPGLLALGLGWLLGQGGLASHHRNLLASATLFLALALIIERGPTALSAIENDRLSLVHVTLFALLGLFWTVVPYRRDRDRPLFRQQRAARRAVHGRLPAQRQIRAARQWPPIPLRTGLAAAGAAGLAALMLILFPVLLQGPLGPVDPLYQSLRLERIVEVQPLIALETLSAAELGHAANRLIQIVGIAAVALPFLVVLLVRPSATQRLWLAVALVLAVFLPLAFYQVRWSIYAQVALLLPYSAGVGWLLHRLARLVPGGALVLCRPLVILIGLFWPLLLGQAFPRKQIVTADQGCPIDRLAPALAAAGGGASGTVLGMADYGPEILYRTAHAVLSIPNHRPQPGFAATLRILSATDPAAARAELERAGVDWILLCPNPVERAVFAAGAPSGTSLYRRLIDGQAPAWLHPLPLPQDVTDAVRLFAVAPTDGPAVAEQPVPEAARVEHRDDG
ncbi:MAG TPA: hypothetical protein VLE23_00170 [Geminicoccaceae bacterium]|nr:hypothetical protein [Geminicoccaceae bacterium]